MKCPMSLLHSHLYLSGMNSITNSIKNKKEDEFNNINNITFSVTQKFPFHTETFDVNQRPYRTLYFKIYILYFKM